MNSTNVSEEVPRTRTHFINFNQDCTSLQVGGRGGYRLFCLSEGVDTLKLIHEYDTEDIHTVERLFNSSLVAVVSEDDPQVLRVCHFKKEVDICRYTYSSSILTVKLNRSRLVVCLEDVIYVYNIRDMSLLYTIDETPSNPSGLCALSVADEGCCLAYPGSSTIGEVQLFDATNLHVKCMVPAHNSPLAALAFNQNGTRLATASEKGTVIRVFAVSDGSRLLEFRRGVKRCVEISCLAFSTCAQYLACSSNTETVHIFKLDEPKDKRSVEDNSWMGYLSTYLPTQVTDVFTQGRAFATAHLPVWGVKNILAITTIQNQLRLLVASEDGHLYVYNVNETEGGDLTLTFQHRIDGLTDEDKPQQEQEAKESEKCREMADATATPSNDGFRFNDDEEYPPLVPRGAN